MSKPGRGIGKAIAITIAMIGVVLMAVFMNTEFALPAVAIYLLGLAVFLIVNKRRRKR